MKTLAFLLLTLATTSAWADTLTGRVVDVKDGDTITVMTPDFVAIDVRFSGVDAPEKDQPFGPQSRYVLAKAIAGKDVEVVYSKRDRYNRVVGKVLLTNGYDACLEQVKAGLAWHFKQYENEQTLDDRLMYRAAEEESRAARRGLWVDAAPVAPWDWRKNK